jgi:hypothetical protein
VSADISLLPRKKEVAFLKKSSAKNFYDLYTGSCNVPREQKVFCGAFLQKSDRFLFQPSRIKHAANKAERNTWQV